MGIAQIDYEALKAKVKVNGKARPVITARAALVYIRKSDPRQKSEGMQLDEMLEYAADVLHVPIYQDAHGNAAIFEEAKSGLIVDRPQYQAAKALAKSGRISHVLLWIPSRWGRNTVEFLTAFAELDALGVEIHMADRLPEQHRLTWDSVDEEAFKAKAEAIQISKRVTPAMRRRAKKGEVMQRRPYGYKRPGPRGEVPSGATEIDPTQGRHIEDLYRRYVEDEESLWSLTKWWNETTGMRKRPFGIRRLLENPFFCGANIHGRTSVSKVRNDIGSKPREEWACGTHDAPIVSVERWMAAQERLARNPNLGQERSTEPQYPLTGLLLCRQCNKRLHGQIARDGRFYRDRPDGQPPADAARYPVYHCPYCGKSKSNRKVETALRSLVDTIPLGPEMVAAAVERQQAAPPPDDIEARIAALLRRRARLMEKWADATTAFDEAAAQDSLDQNARELAELHARQREAARASVADSSAAQTLRWLESLTSWTALLDRATVSERNHVYRQLAERLVVDCVANTLTVAWHPAIARLLGQAEQTVSLVRPRTRRRARSAA